MCSSLKAWVKRIAWFIFALDIILNGYINFYPVLHRGIGCRWSDGAQVKIAAFGDPQITGYSPQQSLRKKIDVMGNDKFLEHTAGTVRQLLRPDFVAVMGDLISSQWIDTLEFHSRADRFARIFPADQPGELLNISGNHDIGYHGEFNEDRLGRFRQRYGQLNFVIHPDDLYRIVVVNSLALDGPPFDDAHHEAWKFIKSLKKYKGSTVLLLHVPLFKPEGICRDGPHTALYDDEYGGGIREQNHLSSDTTKQLLKSVFGGGSGGIIVTGHDHEGCTASYTLDGKVVAGFDNPIKEATVRSLMGEYGGNTGLISGVLRDKSLVWEYSLCPFQVQHLWWTTYVLTVITVIIAFPIIAIL